MLPCFPCHVLVDVPFSQAGFAIAQHVRTQAGRGRSSTRAHVLGHKGRMRSLADLSIMLQCLRMPWFARLHACTLQMDQKVLVHSGCLSPFSKRGLQPTSVTLPVVDQKRSEQPTAARTF